MNSSGVPDTYPIGGLHGRYYNDGDLRLVIGEPEVSEAKQVTPVEVVVAAVATETAVVTELHAATETPALAADVPRLYTQDLNRVSRAPECLRHRLCSSPISAGASKRSDRQLPCL